MSQDEDHNKRPKRWVACSVEEEYFGDERKSGKLERKIAKAKDRSKYKKTDRGKFQKSEELHKNIKLAKEDLLRGRILTIASQGVIVDCEGTLFTCMLRGLLKKDKGHAKNLVTVGDFVLFEKTGEEEGSIAHVEPRHSTLSRADNLSRRKEQLIASNIDQVIVTACVVSPPLKPFLADRYLIAARKGHMDPIIVINKIDLLEDASIDPELRAQEKLLVEGCIEAYKMANIPLVAVSTASGEGMEALMALMKGKTSVFSGQSGVGKSSLINSITGRSLKIGKIVDKTQKGSHTTSTTQLLPLDDGGWCIDTPGIKSFGIWDLKQDEVEEFFTEIHALGGQCRFPNCSHTHEEDCAVIQALERGELSPLRYDSYQSLLEDITRRHLRR